MDENERCEPMKHHEVSLARKTGRMGRLLHQYYSLSARSHGVFGDPLRGQGRVLALLAAKPKTTQRELSYLLDMRQQSLSELLAKLEEKGFITRSKSTEDARVTVVELTEAGAAAAPSPEEMERHADALDCLDDNEREEFERLVNKVVASLEDKIVAMGGDPFAPPHRPHPGRGPRHPHGEGRMPRCEGPRGDEPDSREPFPHRHHQHGWGEDGEHLRQA